MEYQRLRFEGKVTTPWPELQRLEEEVDGLTSGGLDLREAAPLLCLCERGCLHVEARGFREAELVLAETKPAIPLPATLARLIQANRELGLGNILLIRDENTAAAADHYRTALEAARYDLPFIGANASFNLAICLRVEGDDDQALANLEREGRLYEAAGRHDKRGDVLHAIGNTLRQQSNLDQGIQHLHDAMGAYQEHQNLMGLWSTADDIARCYIIKGVKDPGKFTEWLNAAKQMAFLATAFSNEVWKSLQGEPGRLADLSDRMLNHTATRCEISLLEDEPFQLMAVLAHAKGRIRCVKEPVPSSVLVGLDADLREALEAGVPRGYFQTAAHCLQRLAGPGRTVALVDQLVIRGGRLATGYAVLSDNEKRVSGFISEPIEDIDYDPARDLRGRHRTGTVEAICRKLIDEIKLHGRRCECVLGDDPEALDEVRRGQLTEWAGELDLQLGILGEWFFPGEVLEEFRSLGVEHVVLCIDPALAGVPFSH